MKLANLIKRFLKSEKGSAMFEFALVAPFFLALSFAGFEFSRSLKILQVGSTLSREAANLAFRRCSAETGTELTTCLQAVADETVNFSRSALPNATLLISVYTYDEDRTPKKGIRESIVVATSVSLANFANNTITNSPEVCVDTTNMTVPFSRVCRNNAANTVLRKKLADGKVKNFESDPVTNTILEDHKLLIFAESFIEYDPLVGVIGNLLNIENGRYYEATII